MNEDGSPTENELRFYPTKRTVTYKALLFVGLFTFSILALLNADSWDLSAFQKTVLWLASPVVLLGVGFFITRLLSNKPIVCINEKGVYDNSTTSSPGWLSWSEIEDVRLVDVEQENPFSFTGSRFSIRYLDIITYDPWEVVARQRSALKRSLMRMNVKRGFPSARIPKEDLPVSLDELAEIIRGFREGRQYGS